MNFISFFIIYLLLYNNTIYMFILYIYSYFNLNQYFYKYLYIYSVQLGESLNTFSLLHKESSIHIERLPHINTFPWQPLKSIQGIMSALNSLSFAQREEANKLNSSGQQIKIGDSSC